MTSHRFRDRLISMTTTYSDTQNLTAANMLSELPKVFGIEDIVSLFDMPEREAITIADYMEYENETVMGGDNRWIKLPSKEYMDKYIKGYHNLGAVGSLDRLEAFYGDDLRRVEGLHALEHHGVVLSSTLSAASPKKADEEYTLEKFKILHRWEDAETLTLHSSQLDSKTWISSIERCLLELADEMSGPTVMEYLMVGIEITDYSADKMVSAASDLGYMTALRRIGSIIKWIPENHFLPDEAHKIAEMASRMPGEWEEVSYIIGNNKTPIIEDEDFKIIWRVLPIDIYNNTLT